jgi:hypothetical protein
MEIIARGCPRIAATKGLGRQKLRRYRGSAFAEADCASDAKCLTGNTSGTMPVPGEAGGLLSI